MDKPRFTEKKEQEKSNINHSLNTYFVLWMWKSSHHMAENRQNRTRYDSDKSFVSVETQPTSWFFDTEQK